MKKTPAKTHLVLICLILLVSAGFLVALRTHAVEIPVINPEIETALGGRASPTDFGGFIIRLYQFAVGAAGILALGMIVIGAIFRATSAGKPDRIQEGNNMISSALWGLVLLLGSYLILKTINPNLVFIGEPGLVKIEDCQYKNKQGLACDPKTAKPEDECKPINSPCVPQAYQFGEMPIPGEGTVQAIDPSKPLAENTPEFAYCSSLGITNPTRLHECVELSACENCKPLDSPPIATKPNQCKWGSEASQCLVNPKTSAALAALNNAIPSDKGIVVESRVLRDIYMKWEITEAFPPTVHHLSSSHYNGCAVDVVVLVDNRRYLSGADCKYLDQFIKAAQQAGFTVTSEYYIGCSGTKYETSKGEHLHLKANGCP